MNDLNTAGRRRSRGRQRDDEDGVGLGPGARRAGGGIDGFATHTHGEGRSIFERNQLVGSLIEQRRIQANSSHSIRCIGENHLETYFLKTKSLKEPINSSHKISG